MTETKPDDPQPSDVRLIPGGSFRAARTQVGMTAMNHFDLLLPHAGGRFGVTGDYLFQDSAAFGNYQGLWGILRVTP